MLKKGDPPVALLPFIKERMNPTCYTSGAPSQRVKSDLKMKASIHITLVTSHKFYGVLSPLTLVIEIRRVEQKSVDNLVLSGDEF